MSFVRTVLLPLLALTAVPAAAGNRIQCNGNDASLTPPFNPQNALTTYCAPAGADEKRCRATIKKVLQAAHDLNEQMRMTCGKVEQVDPAVLETVGMDPRTAYESQLRVYKAARDEYVGFGSSLQRFYNEIAETLRPETGPLGKPVSAADLAAATAADKFVGERGQIRSAISDASLRKIRDLSVGETRQPESNTGESSTIFSARNGAQYMQRILKKTDEVQASLSQITGMANQLQRQIDNLKQASTPDSRDTGNKNAPSGGSGLDLKSLAGLATAGAGLASALQKKNAAENAAEAGATAPTPPSTNQSEPPGPNVSKLGDGTKGDSRSPISATQPKKDMAPSARVPSGQADSPYSDISKSQGSPFATSTSSPATAKAGGSGGGGTGGGGRGGDSESGATTKAAGAPGAPTEDLTQGIGGGALGGGGPPPFSAGAAPPGGMPGVDAGAANPEAAMTDLLHEMKETAEGGGASPDAQAGLSDIAMADDDLFPRIRAAYVRVMKAGKVLDGLGEKITPEAP